MSAPRIIATYIEPPIPVAGFWQAYDDTLGADASPYGEGATREVAIADLVDQLEDRALTDWSNALHRKDPRARDLEARYKAIRDMGDQLSARDPALGVA